jgi:peptidyl-tRNA hydrolase, PTH1 family
MSQIGFMIVDRLGADAGISVDKKQHNAVVGKGRLHGPPVLLAKPTTFMNSSGKAVRKLMDYYKVTITIPTGLCW